MNSIPADADAQHLRLLSAFHYVAGGLTVLFACFPLIHLALGLAMVFSPSFFQSKPGEHSPPQVLGWAFVLMGGLMFLIGQSLAVCTLLAGRFIAQRKRYWFVFVTACMQCALFPFGTALGVFTIITLSRQTVKSLFGLTAPVTSAV